MANVLHEFCAASGLKVSLEKSRALASKGVTTSRKNKIRQITQINFTDDLGKYLGFRIIHGRQWRDDFAEVMERMESKLASWKGRLLNKPGRLTLAKSVLSATPTYACSFAGIHNLCVTTLTGQFEISYGKDMQIMVCIWLVGRGSRSQLKWGLWVCA